MRNLLTILICAAFGAVLFGCGNGDGGGTAADNSQPKPQGTVPVTTSATPPGPSGSASPGGEGG